MPVYRIGLLLLSVAGLVLAQAVPQRDPDVPFVPSPNDVVTAMLKLADVKKGDTVIDLGCGDGRIVIAAARTGARAIGVDINPERIRDATQNAQKAGVTNRVTFRQGDLFEADIKEASVVTLYLLPSVNLKLKPKLLADLKPGTRIVSHDFDMGDWKPERELDIGSSRIFLWKVPNR